MADDDDRWTVRGVSKECQEAAKAAAGRLKVSIGAYLTAAIEEAIADERMPAGGAVVSFEEPRRVPAWPEDDLVDIERTIAAAVALAGAPNVPQAFRRRANRVLRERLPRPPPGRRPGAAAPAGLLPAPESETPAT